MSTICWELPVSASDSRRVALLARPGAAREQLRIALSEAGSAIVLEDDPNAVDAATLQDAAPEVVLVALEPAIEDALERLEAVLDDPSLVVIFDEADVAARREGWDVRRWVRHLSAKMHGHDDVLPPGREEEPSLALEPGLPPTPAQLHADDRIEKHLEEAADIAWELPQDDFAQRAAQPAGQIVDADGLRASAPPAPEHGPEPAPVPPSLPDLKLELSLEPIDPVVGKNTGPRPPGAVIAFAGIGGPDAVRKLLAELPADFPRPLIVHLKLDGGRYDNLVRQMARVSAMPVSLAAAGHPALPGHVYVLPGDVSLRLSDGAVDFHEGGDLRESIAELPPRDSGVLLLSGSDAHWVDIVWPLAQKGAWIAGQSPDGCYDPTASHALAARGGVLATPVELAQRLGSHWAG